MGEVDGGGLAGRDVERGEMAWKRRRVAFEEGFQVWGLFDMELAGVGWEVLEDVRAEGGKWGAEELNKEQSHTVM